MTDKLDDHRLILGKTEYVPIMIGGMGADISRPEMAQEAARLGGIGHISDALSGPVADRYFKTDFIKNRLAKYKGLASKINKKEEQFDYEEVKRATGLLVDSAMTHKKGPGGIFINIMEKLTMNNPKETLKARLLGALDAGIDGISLSAGLHLGSFALMQDHPRFREAKLGIIVSSLRALQLFLKKTAKMKRLPDFVVVEGPLAGGHLGFRIDNWFNFDLKIIAKEIIDFLKKEELNIPVLPAGGIFTGGDAIEMMGLGASGIQVANRFTVAEESGLPFDVKQKYFEAEKKNIVVNGLSPTGYPMRMLTGSPCIGSDIKPNCESLGYLLDQNGDCSYIQSYYAEQSKDAKDKQMDKTCLCTHMKNFKTWTCGHLTYKLKETTHKLKSGLYQILTVEHIFKDYLLSTEDEILLPEKLEPPEEDRKAAVNARP